MPWKVYILKSFVANKTYVGFTNDIDRRISEHNFGKSMYTKRYMPWRVIHTETYDTMIEAQKREKYLKAASGRKFLKNIILRPK